MTIYQAYYSVSLAQLRAEIAGLEACPNLSQAALWHLADLRTALKQRAA